MIRASAPASASCGGRRAECVEWISKYLGDCVCNTRDAVSFGVGLVSIVCWGVAEVPQIITNCREGSTEGISLLFLMTWVLGDAFNLIGCYLEPSTLPTQFYMALLYTITTLILVGQVIYYQHFLKWRKARVVKPTALPHDEVKDGSKPTERIQTGPPASSQPIAYAPSSPASVAGRELYIMSARSLASSRTPTAGSYLAAGSRGSGGGGGRASSYSLLQHNSLEDSPSSHPIPISINTSRSTPPAPIVAASSPSILRAVVSLAMCVGGLNLGRGRGLTAKYRAHTFYHTLRPRVFSARKLLLFDVQDAHYTSGTLHQTGEMQGSIGVWFGWMMAVIYMGGRLPQIWLNIKRGSVEGLNPLMFTFALLGNVTYVGSILIRSTEWKKIKSNMPWLVDAGVCVILDCFILCQFIYYCSSKRRDAKDNSRGDYKYLEA